MCSQARSIYGVFIVTVAIFLELPALPGNPASTELPALPGNPANPESPGNPDVPFSLALPVFYF